MGKNIIILFGEFTISNDFGGEVDFDISSTVLSVVFGGVHHQATISIAPGGINKYSFSFDSGVEISYFNIDKLSFKINCIFLRCSIC